MVIHFINRQAVCRRKAIVYLSHSLHCLSGFHPCSMVLRLLGKLKAASATVSLGRMQGEMLKGYLDQCCLGCLYTS